ncbi:MAG TPA: hypothetical protein VNV38_04310, partial [Stellaceae bacterium]|nr:hypothetical protein [Stellaceae bacterium]
AGEAELDVAGLHQRGHQIAEAGVKSRLLCASEVRRNECRDHGNRGYRSRTSAYGCGRRMHSPRPQQLRPPQQAPDMIGAKRWVTHGQTSGA